MPDYRAFCSPATAEPVEIVLSPDESHHLIAVNRARVGVTVVVFDGRGTEWICELTGEKKNAATLKVRFKQKIKPLAYEITLGQALPKGPSMDAIVRKATEIGAARIIPLESERTQVHFDGDRSDKKIEKRESEEKLEAFSWILLEICFRIQETEQKFPHFLLEQITKQVHSISLLLQNIRLGYQKD